MEDILRLPEGNKKTDISCGSYIDKTSINLCLKLSDKNNRPFIVQLMLALQLFPCIFLPHYSDILFLSRSLLAVQDRTRNFA